MRVNALVVTYNRLPLLKECLSAIENQTVPIEKIVIVDNCSTDGTREYLSEKGKDDRYMVIRPVENVGGAGGFSLGVKASVLAGCDYTWLMDDDTVPNADALERMLEVDYVYNRGRIGFICSKVVWTDGNVHVMNRPGLMTKKSETNNGNCHSCSFVSVMISSAAVYDVGLPLKEFFIWCDDIEYTQRISDAGYDCFYCMESVVVHKTASNYFPSIDQAPSNMAWRFYFQARNTCYLNRRKHTSWLSFMLSVANKYRIYKHRLKKRTDGDRKEFLSAVKKGCRDGLKFRPEIEFLPKN